MVPERVERITIVKLVMVVVMLLLFAKNQGFQFFNVVAAMVRVKVEKIIIVKHVVEAVLLLHLVILQYVKRIVSINMSILSFRGLAER